MEILIKKIKENKDGSAEVHVHYDKEGLHFRSNTNGNFN